MDIKMADRTRLSKTRRLEYAQAATRAFAKRGGYHGATLNDIAIEAGVTQPRISQVYGHKLDAFLESYEFATGELLAAWAGHRPRLDQPGWEQRLGEWYRDALTQDRDKFLVVQYAISAAQEPRVGAAVRDFADRVWTLLTREYELSAQDATSLLSRGLLLQFSLAAGLSAPSDEHAGLPEFAAAAFATGSS